MSAAKAFMDPVVKDILQAALAEFASHGLAGARIDAIAARTRTSKRMIYYHFGNKERLYAAVVEHAFRDVRAGEARPELRVLAPIEALRRYAGMAFDSHADHPDFVRLVMVENLAGARFLGASETTRQINADNLAVMQDILSRGQEQGLMRADITALDLYTNLVAMGFHFVANRLSFAANFGLPVDDPHYRAARRASVVDATLRYALVDPSTSLNTRITTAARTGAKLSSVPTQRKRLSQA